MSEKIKRSEYNKREDIISLNFFIIKEFYKRIEGNKLSDLYSDLGITRNGFGDIIRNKIVTRLIKKKELKGGIVAVDTKLKVTDLFGTTGLNEDVFCGKLELIRLLEKYDDKGVIDYDKQCDIIIKEPREYKEYTTVIDAAIEKYREKSLTDYSDFKKNDQLACLYYYCKEKRRLNSPDLHFLVLKKILTETISDQDFIECKEQSLLEDLEKGLKNTLAKVQATMIYKRMENHSGK